jgi:ribonuclease D
MNRPLFKVIGDQTLIWIAVQPPASLEQLRLAPGMTPKQIQRHGQHLLQAVQRGQQARPIHPPRHPRPDERLLIRLDLLRRWRKETGEKLQMASDVVLPRDLMISLAENNPTTPEALAEQMRDAPWRLEHFGPQILALLTRRKQE